MQPLPRRRKSILVGPIFAYELVRIARRGRCFLIRGMCACLFAMLVLGMYWVWSRLFEQGKVPPSQMSAFAEAVFVIFLGLQFALAILITPAYTAAAITDEKERNTLAFLLATDLRGRELVLGKFAARVLNVLLLLFVGLPIVGLLELLGGVELGIVLSGLTMLVTMVVMLAALSILASVYARRSRAAVIATYLLPLVYVFLSSLAFELLHTGQLVLWPGNPPFTIAELMYVQGTGNPFILYDAFRKDVSSGTPVGEAMWEIAANFAQFSLVVAALCAIWAVLCVRAVALRHLFAVEPERAVRTRRRWWRVGNRPLVWKELHAGRGTWRRSFGQFFVFVLALATLTLPGYVALGHLDGLTWWRHENRFIADFVNFVSVGAACCALLGVLLRAASSITGEREQQTLDSVLTTPHEAASILFAKGLGSILSSRGVWLWLAVLWIEGFLLSGHSPVGLVNLPRLFALWIVFAAFYAALGLWFSVACRTNLRALIASLLAGAGVTLGHWLLWLGYYPFVLMTAEPPQAAARLARVHFGLTPPVLLAAVGQSLEDLEMTVVEWVTYYLGYTPHAVLGPLFRDGNQGWRGPVSATAGELQLLVLLDLTCWLLGAGLLWWCALVRFRAQTGRSATPRPEIAIPAENEEARAVADFRAAQERSSRRRLLRRVALGSAIALLPVAAYVYLDWAADHELRQAIAYVNSVDPGWELKDLEAARAVYPKEQNGAEQVKLAHSLLPRNWMKPYLAGRTGWTNQLPYALPKIRRNQQLDVHLVAALRSELQPLSAALTAARALADMPDGRYAVSWASDFVSTLLPHVDMASNHVACLLQDDAFLRAQEGDMRGALESTQAMLNTARSLGDEPVLITMLVRSHVDAITVAALERVLAQGEAAEADLAAMQTLLELESVAPPLRTGIRGTRAMLHGLLDRLEHDLTLGEMTRRMGMTQHALPGLDWLNKASYKYAHAALLRHVTRVAEVSQAPVEEWESRFAELGRREEKLPWLARLLVAGPWISQMSNSSRRGQALLRCAATGVAAERFRLAAGRWPTTLDELVPRYLKEVPRDPYDGQPLRYRRQDGKVVIYAVGKDGRDNSGTFGKNPDDAGSDIGFRLWDVAQRRQPPRNPAGGPPLPLDND